jgi:hypothetical protein
MMIYSPVPRLNSNLTIALIQRDQRNPEQRGHYLPAAYCNVDITPCPESTLRPAAWPYRFSPTASDSANTDPPQAVQPYMPHAIPTNPTPVFPQKFASWTADQMDRLIDIYA